MRFLSLLFLVFLVPALSYANESNNEAVAARKPFEVELRELKMRECAHSPGLKNIKYVALRNDINGPLEDLGKEIESEITADLLARGLIVVKEGHNREPKEFIDAIKSGEPILRLLIDINIPNVEIEGLKDGYKLANLKIGFERSDSLLKNPNSPKMCGSKTVILSANMSKNKEIIMDVYRRSSEVAYREQSFSCN